MVKVITYGTYDLLHYGHIKLLERAKALGDYLIVGVTADDFDKTRGKINVQQSLMERIEAVRATGLADKIIVEEYEGQKIDDIRRYDVDIFTVGSDWAGKFDYLNEYCKVVYLPRTEGISSSEVRSEQCKLRMGIVGKAAFRTKFVAESKYVNGVDQLIERRRQGLGKPNLLYVKDLYAGLSQSNYWEYENQTSGGLKSELPGVWKSNGSKTDINNTDSSETDLIYSAPYVENTSKEMREDERYRLYFQDKLEIPILEKNFPHDREILMEILELLVETVTSRKKFLRICGEEKSKEVVKSRLMKLDSMHIQYVMECLKSNTTQVRNIKQYLLATLYNAPTTIDSYYAAQVRHDFGWGGRSN